MKKGVIVPAADVTPPNIPMDYAQAVAEGLVRKPTNFISTICDESGDVHNYAGMPIDEVIEKKLGIGGVIGLLWFKKEIPPYAREFLEMVIQIIADHGAAVAGAHNTIVTARAGKDLLSSLVTGILTIGPRFGGAVNGAAEHFLIGLRGQHGAARLRRPHEGEERERAGHRAQAAHAREPRQARRADEELRARPTSPTRRSSTTRCPSSR